MGEEAESVGEVAGGGGGGKGEEAAGGDEVSREAGANEEGVELTEVHHGGAFGFQKDERWVVGDEFGYGWRIRANFEHLLSRVLSGSLGLWHLNYWA